MCVWMIILPNNGDETQELTTLYRNAHASRAGCGVSFGDYVVVQCERISSLDSVRFMHMKIIRLDYIFRICVMIAVTAAIPIWEGKYRPH